jgi:hypothetical protein
VNARKPAGGTFSPLDPEALNKVAWGIAEAVRGAAEAFEEMGRNLRLREALGASLSPVSDGLDRMVAALSDDERDTIAQAAYRIRASLDRMEK